MSVVADLSVLGPPEVLDLRTLNFRVLLSPEKEELRLFVVARIMMLI